MLAISRKLERTVKLSAVCFHIFVFPAKVGNQGGCHPPLPKSLVCSDLSAPVVYIDLTHEFLPALPVL